jgi:hypothetical protein
MDVASCEVEIYAEVKALAGGSTSVIGGLLKNPKYPDNEKCAAGLARNLDTDSGLRGAPTTTPDGCPTDPATDRTILDVVDNEVFPFEVVRGRFDYLVCQLGRGVLHGLVIHLAEGSPTNPNAHEEFNMLNKEILWDSNNKVQIARPGLNIIHGTALRDRDFVAMKGSNLGLIWSARSNDELYGSSTNIASARSAGVDVAIAPDWSPSGSSGMLQEIGYIARHYTTFSASDLIPMATAVPAKLARIADQIGSLEAGKKADFIVLSVRIDPKAKKPLDPVAKATPAEVRLVVVGGEPLYGDASLLAALLPRNARLDHLEVCGADKAVYLGQSAAVARNESFQDIVNTINETLAKSGESIPEIECE